MCLPSCSRGSGIQNRHEGFKGPAHQKDDLPRHLLSAAASDRLVVFVPLRPQFDALLFEEVARLLSSPMLPTIGSTNWGRSGVEEHKAVVGPLNESKRQSSVAESDKRSHGQECLVHGSNSLADNATNGIVELMDRLFTVEELIAIRGLLDNRPAEIPKILTKSARVFSASAVSALANPAAFQKRLQFTELVRT